MFQLFKKKTQFLPKMTVRDWLVLVAGGSVFVTVAASTVTKFSIWFDEAFGSYLIRFDYAELTRYTAYDVHPPLYYWLLKTWSLLFGNTELGIRSMSVFFGLITIIIAFVFVLKYFGRRAAYVSLLFLVISPLFIRYSQEARMYTLLTAIIISATYILLYAQENAKKRWPWVVYGILLALGMLTQYFAALAWLSHWVWRGIVVRGSEGAFKKNFFSQNWILAHVTALLLFLPWLPWLIRQFADVQGNGFWIPPVTSMTVPDFLTDFLLFTDHNGTKSWLALLFYAVLISCIILVVRVMNHLKGIPLVRYQLLVAMAITPIILLVIISMPPLRSAFIDRYLMATILFLPILLAVTIGYSRAFVSRPRLVILTLTLVGLFGTGVYEQMKLGNYNKSTNQSNNVRQLVEKVREKSPNGTPIIANTPWVFYEAAIYSRPDSTIYFANETTTYEFGSLRMLKENAMYKITDVDAFKKEHPSFWVISNLKDGSPNKLRDSWKVDDTITIDDDLSHKPLFRAIHISAE